MDIGVWVWSVSLLLGIGLLAAVTRYGALWQHNKPWAEAAAAALVAATVFIFTLALPLWALVALLLCHAWLVILALRVAFGRLEPQFVRRSTGLNLVIGVVIIIDVLVKSLLPLDILITIVLCAAVVVGLLFLRQVLWTLRKFSLPPGQMSMKELPTVSVCIPARNEDHALTKCLEAVMQSDYPKMEVIVLDDCSQDKTAEIVRTFAHAGVRFVEGKAPNPSWLGKNQSMATLVEHASGDLILCMSVDTTLAPQSLSRLVHFAMRNKLSMVSVLPQNRLSPRLSTMFAPMQYVWHMVLPVARWHVPVSSKSWLIKADVLKELGGFGAVKRAVVPEAVFARQLLAKDQYRFIVSDSTLAMTTAKKWRSQVETSLRLVYPIHQRQPFLLLARLAAVGCGFLLPLVTLCLTSVLSSWFWLSALALGLFLLSYMLALSRTHPGSWWLNIWLLPVVVVQDMVLATLSMLAYEFSEVRWKGRNICYPVLKLSGPFVRREP